jgi:hypothetical protein
VRDLAMPLVRGPLPVHHRSGRRVTPIIPKLQGFHRSQKERN